MSTVFTDPSLWQHASFTFVVRSRHAIDGRGNATGQGRRVVVTFKLRSQRNLPQRQSTEPGTNLTEVYSCRVVSVDGNLESVSLPREVNPGDVGSGTLNNRPCRATIRGMAQSSISPLLRPILGESVTLEVSYAIRGGSTV